MGGQTCPRARIAQARGLVMRGVRRLARSDEGSRTVRRSRALDGEEVGAGGGAQIAVRDLPYAQQQEGNYGRRGQSFARGPTFSSGSQRKSCWLRKKAMAALTERAIISGPICEMPTRATMTRSKPVTR